MNSLSKWNNNEVECRKSEYVKEGDGETWDVDATEGGTKERAVLFCSR